MRARRRLWPRVLRRFAVHPCYLRIRGVICGYPLSLRKTRRRSALRFRGTLKFGIYRGFHPTVLGAYHTLKFGCFVALHGSQNLRNPQSLLTQDNHSHRYLAILKFRKTKEEKKKKTSNHRHNQSQQRVRQNRPRFLNTLGDAELFESPVLHFHFLSLFFLFFLIVHTSEVRGRAVSASKVKMKKKRIIAGGVIELPNYGGYAYAVAQESESSRAVPLAGRDASIEGKGNHSTGNW